MTKKDPGRLVLTQRERTLFGGNFVAIDARAWFVSHAVLTAEVNRPDEDADTPLVVDAKETGT